MGKKRKKKKRGGEIRKEKDQETKTLLGMKLSEAIAKKESDVFSEKRKPKVTKRVSRNGVKELEDVPAFEDHEAEPEILAQPPKPKYRVYTPEKKLSAEKPKKKTPKTTYPITYHKQNPIPQKTKTVAQEIKKEPEENWVPVQVQEKISLKMSSSRYRSQTKIQTVNFKKEYSWQVKSNDYSEERDIVIGFDLGTACSKVILQDHQLKMAFAVPFENFSYEANKYLLPTKLHVDSNGNISFCGNGKEVKDLKISFVEDHRKVIFEEKDRDITATAFDLIAAYIGLTLKEVRRWFRENKSLEYSRSLISWEINLGIPARDYENEKLVEAMKLAGLTGWNLTLPLFEKIRLGNVRKARQMAERQIKEKTANDDNEQIHPDNVNIIPEIIAEVTGYSRSPMRRNGMFLLVDVGASTLDVSTFILNQEDNQDSYPILFADVGKLGGYELHKHRISQMIELVENKLCELSEACDGISPLPERKDYFPELNNHDFTIFSASDESFCDKCSIVMRRVVKTTKDKRNPHSNEWRDGLPVFLCGGGSKIQLYEKAVKNTFLLLKQIGIQGFNFIPLPKPENIETDDIPPDDYHRVAVSYGLSFSEFDIGKIIPQKELDDIEPFSQVKDYRDNYIDKDMV